MSSLVNSQCPYCGSQNQKPVHELYLKHMRLVCANCNKEYSAKDNLRPLSQIVDQGEGGVASKNRLEIDSGDYTEILARQNPSPSEASNTSGHSAHSVDKVDSGGTDNTLKDVFDGKSDKSLLDKKPSLNILDREQEEKLEASLSSRDSRIKPIANPNFPKTANNDEIGGKGLSSADELDDNVRHALNYDDSFDDVTLTEKRPDESGKKWSTVVYKRLLFPLALMALILVQTHYFWLDKISQFPKMRPALEQWCRLSKCTLPPLEAVSAVDIIQSRLNEQKNGNVKLHFTLLNSSQFPTILPVIELHFGDINQNIISNFHLAPNDYSPFIETMKANEQISFSVEFNVNSPVKVSSYEIRVVSALGNND